MGKKKASLTIIYKRGKKKKNKKALCRINIKLDYML